MLNRNAIVTILAVGAFGCAAMNAGADDAVSEKMTCAAIRKVLDASQLDTIRAAEIFIGIERIYDQMDRANVTKGRPAIFARMNSSGKQNTVAMATARCDDYPGETMRKSAVTVYKGLEAVGRALGVN